MIRYNPNINEGLNNNQVQYRNKYNYINKIDDIKTNSIYKIILSNLVTYFNLLNLFIGILFYIGNSYKYIVFICVIVLNALINIIKEIRTNIVINKFKSSNEFVNVIRESNIISINASDVVLDDIVLYKENSNIVTDSIILDGEVLVDESCLTGKKPLIKRQGEMLYTGCKVITGKCICRAERVGNSNYLSKVINIVKKKKCSYINRLLNTVILYTSIIVLILSIVFYIHTGSIYETINHIYKMLPIEFVLLTTISFLISVIKLKKKNVLVKSLSSIESIRKIDTICFDKTGTLTKNNMIIEKVIVLNKKYDYAKILSSIGKYGDKSNEIIDIISKKYNKKTDLKFISLESYSGYIKITFKDNKYYLGDPTELKSNVDISKYLEYKPVLLKTEKEDIALILLSYELKSNVKKLIHDLDINIKLISGDNKETLQYISNKIGLKRVKSIDMSVNNTNMNHQIVEDYNVFYNTSPEQKKILINALKSNNHKVLMVGDGINDILGLDASNSSISINNGDSIKVSDYIILNDRIDVIKNIIDISRSSLNNIFKIIYLYLFKLIYSFLLVITSYIFNIEYNFLIYELIFIIPSLFIIFISDYEDYNINIKEVVNKSILISLFTYLITLILFICKVVFNIDISIIDKSILLLVSLVEFITLLKFKLLNKLLLILLIIIAFSCIIIL